jgi:miniconductance mechanosensitive channel
VSSLRVEHLAEWLAQIGLGRFAGPVATLILIAVVLLAAWLTRVLVRRGLVRFLQGLAQRTRTHWDDRLVEHRFFDRLSHLAPAIVIHLTADQVLAAHPTLATLIERVVLVYMTVIAASAIDAAVSAGTDILTDLPSTRDKPIQSYAQVIKILVFIAAGVVAIATLLGRSPWIFLSGLGALTAVVLLIFKDSILGFVASVQIAAHDLVRKGDWIEMPKHGADGDIVEINLTTVKVQNWDKTITTIPTYALVSESFKNWRGMRESGGRRIKRAVHVDMNSIRFVDAPLLERFHRIRLLKDYLTRKEAELAAWNREHQIDDTSLVNGRRLTNVGTFRAYVEAYLRSHPMIHQDLTFLVRQLDPGPTGLPIELYVFSREQRWAQYEAIQADIFDHILAVVPQFDLRVFQEPSGADFRSLRSGPPGEEVPT